MLARKHLLALVHQPLWRTVLNIHHRTLCTQKEQKNELEEKKGEKNEQDKKEQSEQEKHKEQKHERADKRENYKKHERDDEQKSKKWIPWVLGGGSIAVTVFVGNYTYTRHQEDKAPRLAFECGHIPSLNIPLPFIPKDAEISDLSQVIEASAIRGQYLVIYGEHGCGKTTLISQICNSDMIRKHGCVYISIPEPTDDEKKGVKQINAAEALVAPFSYLHSGLWSYIADAFSRNVTEDSPVSPKTLKSTLSLIERGAKEFASWTHNINHLAMAAPLDLEALQDRAKEWADKRILTVIFVSSDGTAPPQLKDRSAYSRAAEYFARGIPEPVAVDFLCKKLEKEIAEQVVHELTGDRLNLIIAVATSDKHNYTEIQAAIFQKMESVALSLLNSSDRNIAATAGAVITAILNSPSKCISFTTFKEIVSTTIAPGAEVSNVIDTLRRSQVFFADLKIVTFQSAGMLAYLENNPPPATPPPSPSAKRFWWF